MQQAAGDHMEYLQLPYDMLYEKGMVFLLTKLCLKIHRMPSAYETIRVGTAPVSTQGPRIFREFVMETGEGERLISGLSAWVLFDPARRKLLRPAKFPYPMPFEPSSLEGAVTDIELPSREALTQEFCSSIRVGYSHLDCNQHVNNCVYGDFVCDMLPFEELRTRGLDTVAIHFQHEARWGDTISMTSGPLGEGRYLVSGGHERGTCFEALACLLSF